ncbi:MAG: putative zinc-binding protein [candidate division Zixibacteria bacterium]|nr:putative zinc-binding protein [candidate division Zixibacteria bacterium]
MNPIDACNNETPPSDNAGYEIARIRKTQASCSLCEDYAARHAAKPVAVMSCEGACLRGEISRQAANILCHELAREQTVRVCLGGAFTKNTGQRSLVRNAGRVIAIEGCPIMCATRSMQGVIDDLKPEVIFTDKSCSFDQSLFGVDEMPEPDIKACAREVAKKVVATL